MSKKIKLLTLFSTLTTVGIEPISDLANSEIMRDDSNDFLLNSLNTLLKSSSGGEYSKVGVDNEVTNFNTTPFLGYVPTTFEGKDTYDNGSFTTIKNHDYLVVPFWVASTKRPHYDSFASYSIDPDTKQLAIINSKIDLGYDVKDKIILPPQVVGEELVSFYRDVDAQNPYGKGEWTVGVTNIKTGSFTNYSLSSAIGNSTVNFRNIYLMVDDSDSLTPNYYLAAYDYTTEGKIMVLKLDNFDPKSNTYETHTQNNYTVNYPNTYDVTFGNGFATPKHEYSADYGQEWPLFGWNNLLEADGIKPIIVDYTPYTEARGYWLFQTDQGLMFANLGNDKDGQANLQIGIIDSSNKAKPTATFSFSPTDENFDFYQGTAITFSFFKGYNDIYYLIPSGVKSDTPDISSLPLSSQYFAFNIELEKIINLNSYSYNDPNTLFKDGQNFLSSRINYVASTGLDLISTDIRLASSTVSQIHFRTQASSLIDKFTSFLSQNLYFVDLTEIYNGSATESQKSSIEKVAQWLGKNGDYTFTPMTLTEIKTALAANFPTDMKDVELTGIMIDFIDIQSLQVQTSLQNAYNSWIFTIEATSDGTGHQWGWYNPQNLSSMFPTYVIDSENGLTYDRTDSNLKNPRLGLQRLLAEFHKKLSADTPMSFTSFLEEYSNPTSGGIIEQTLTDFKTFNKNQLDWFRQKIADEFNTFYYGFSDLNPTNNLIWNYFLDSETYDVLESIDKMAEKWKILMSNAEYNGKTVANFFVNSKIWANLSIDKIIGKDASVEQFPFEYTPELTTFKTINIDSFNAVVDDLYDNFMSKEYLGFADESDAKLDVSMYFSGKPISIMKKWDFAASFPHNAKTTYTYFSKFYTFTPGSGKHDITRTEQFEDWVNSQRTSLGVEILKLINIIIDNYYGYASLAGNNITKYIFPTLNIDEEMNWVTITDNYFSGEQPIDNDLFLARYGTKSLIDQFLDPQNPDTKAWIDDQKNQLRPSIQQIIDWVKDRYYGWILTGNEDTITKVDKLFAFYPLGTELDADAVIATFKVSQVPGGISSLAKLRLFVNDITLDDAEKFNLNQVAMIDKKIGLIISTIEAGYYGYEVKDESVKYGKIAQIILYGHLPGKIDVSKVSNYFNNGVKEGKVGFPTRMEVGGFLTDILNGPEISAFLQDQYNQLLVDFNNFIERIRPNFYGYDMSDDEELRNNFLVKHVVFWGDPSDPGLIWTAEEDIKNFVQNFPTGYSLLKGLWDTASFLQSVSVNDSLFEEVKNFQNEKMLSRWNADVWFPRIKENWYGYSFDVMSSDLNLLAVPFFYQAMFEGLSSGSTLDSLEIFELFKKNLLEKGDKVNVPYLHVMSDWFAEDSDLEDYVDDLIQFQRYAIERNINHIMFQMMKNNWNMFNPDTTEFGKKIIDIWFNRQDSNNSAVIAMLYPKSPEDIWSNTIDWCDDYWKGDRNIYSHLNTGEFPKFLKSFEDDTKTAALTYLRDIWNFLSKYYWGFNFTQNWNSADPDLADTDVFIGARYIFSFFKNTNNNFGGTTLELPSSPEEMYDVWVANMDFSSPWTYPLRGGLLNFTNISSLLSHMMNGAGFVNSFIEYQKKMFSDGFKTIAETYINNYYGYATDDDLSILNNWFGPRDSFLTIEQILEIAMAYIQTLDIKQISSAITDLSTKLGTAEDSETSDTILGRDLKAAKNELNSINKLWRESYYGFSGYTGNWFKETFVQELENWKDLTTHADFANLRTAAAEKSQLLKNYISQFIGGGPDLSAFKAYQESEMSKLLQPIVDFYNQWYMGYNATDTYLLEKTDPSSLTGWSYSDVLSKISSGIVKDNNTRIWEAQSIHSIYDSNTKQNSFRSEQMSSLVTAVNDELIANFLKVNYFGYNFGAGIPSNVQTILSWQNSTETNAIWDTTIWSNDAWENTTTSTYKIFVSIDSNHISNLQSGKSFKDVLADYTTKTTDSIGAEFSDFQLQALSIELTSLIARYQAAYFGYTSAEVINTNYLPGLIPTSNGNNNWSIDEAIKILVSDPGSYQDANRHISGKWLHNTAIDLIGKKIDQEPDNFIAKEKAAFDADVAKILADYSKIFRGFVNDINGNKLTYKSLGGDDAIANGVFVAKAGDITTEIFNQQAFVTYLNTMRSMSIDNTVWEGDILSAYDRDRDAFKAEQEQILRNSLDSIYSKYSAISKGYFTKIDGTPLQYSNLPGWNMGISGPQIDLDLTMRIFDQQTYNQMVNPDPSKAEYRLSSDIYKEFDDNAQNFANEQIDLISKDIAITEAYFGQQSEIFDFLNETESNKNWKTQPTNRREYGDFDASKAALVQFLNKFGNQTSVADLNSMSSNWYSLVEGLDDADWNNANARHTFLFFAEYGMPLQIVYEPGETIGKATASLVDLNTGLHLIHGEIDSITFLPSSKEGNQQYKETLVIKTGDREFSYRIMSSNNNSPFDQLLFTVSDKSSGTPVYELAQKITIVKNQNASTTSENSLSSLTYDETTFNLSNASPDYDGTEISQIQDEPGVNKIVNLASVHQTTKAVRDIYIQMGVGIDLSTGEEIRSNIAIMSPDNQNRVFSIDEVISRLPSPLPPIVESGSGPLSWIMPIIIVVGILTVVAPLAYLIIRKLRMKKSPIGTVKKFTTQNIKPKTVISNPTNKKTTPSKKIIKSLFKSKK